MDKNKAKATSAKPMSPSKRAGLKAMAAQTASPKEAAIALAKLGDSPEGRLEAIAIDIKAEYGRGLDAQWAIARLLKEAATMFPPSGRGQEGQSGSSGGSPYGDWFRAQDFPFSWTTAYRLRIAADREPEVRAFLSSRSSQNATREASVAGAIQLIDAGKNAKPTAHAAPELPSEPVDPAYAALRTAHRLLVEEGGFESMHIDDMAKCAGFIKDLVASYTEAKAARAA